MRPRDRRSFGRGPYLAGLARTDKAWGDGHPFDVAAVAQLPQLRLDQPVTLLAGENGTGKSTIIEALAAALGFPEQGGEYERSGALPATPRPVLDETLEPVLTAAKPRGGYFLRAESFFNVAAYVDEQDIHSPDLSLYGGRPLHQQSHGESFLALASHRFAGESMYILDEPEAALSATSCLALLAVIARATAAGAQFVIATHSPILLAAPGARIYELDADGAAPCSYDALDAVRLMRGFLDAPDRYLRAALDA
ncbi:MAG TPA: AAA family ATPase [Baekduia sp.]|uniref:AAA family ATPase n=1 Tax=Baekduia sp. TaxID=2600305 RepID=UPI002D77AD94|nr:AAA family ATPase [Baekduia sp.]HET6507798.1 AAA family ATPase [Baekduia sp.]